MPEQSPDQDAAPHSQPFQQEILRGSVVPPHECAVRNPDAPGLGSEAVQTDPMSPLPGHAQRNIEGDASMPARGGDDSRMLDRLSRLGPGNLAKPALDRRCVDAEQHRDLAGRKIGCKG